MLREFEISGDANQGEELEQLLESQRNPRFRVVQQLWKSPSRHHSRRCVFLGFGVTNCRVRSELP
jgi:hypothetical protein